MKCPKCSGNIHTLNALIHGNNRIRYLGCSSCGFRPENNKVVIPLKYAPPRLRARTSIEPEHKQ